MAKEIVIPWELKYKFAFGGWTSLFKGLMYAIILNVFKLEGNDAETIANWWAIWFEIIGTEYSVLECSKAISRLKITKCTFKTEPKDLCDWDLIFSNIVVKAINPKAVFYEPKRMCAGDPYCEFVNKIEE